MLLLTAAASYQGHGTPIIALASFTFIPLYRCCVWGENLGTDFMDIFHTLDLVIPQIEQTKTIELSIRMHPCNYC